MCFFVEIALPLPELGFAIVLPKRPDLSLSVDIGIELKLRSFALPLPELGFAIVLPKRPEFPLPTCPLE
jgi:hypothetical protein